MAYQKSTQFSGFRQRIANDDSKQFKDLAKNLEKENSKTLKDFNKAAAAQITEMGRVSKLEAAADTYELNNLRKFSKELDGFLDSTIKNVVAPVFDAQMQDGINQGILAAQGDTDALDKVRLNDLQELELEQRSNKIVEETEFKTEQIKEKYQKDLQNDLRTEYRLLNLKKQNSNFARGYRKGMLMEAATGWDAYRDSVLTNSSNYDIQNMEVEFEGENYRIGDYYNIKHERVDEIRNKILARVQSDYIAKEGNGFSRFLVNKHLINPIIERTNLFQQKEFKKNQLELAQERLNDLKVKFETNFAELESDVGQAKAVAVIQHALNILPSTMKMAGVEGSYNQAAKAKLIEMLTDKGSFLYNGSLANQDDQNDILDFFEKPLFYVKGVSKMEGNTMKLSSLSDLMAGAINREQLQSAMLAAQYERSAKEIEGKKINLKQTLEKINIEFKGDATGKALALNEVMNEHYGKYWAKTILNNNIDGYEGVEPYDEDQSVQVLLDLEKKYNVGDEKYGIIPLSAVNLERIDPAVLAAYIEDGKIGDPYAKEPGAYAKHTGYAEDMTKLAEVIFSRNVGNGSLTQADADLQTDNFTKFISPLLLSTARGYVANNNVTLNEGLDMAFNYWKSQLQGFNGKAADGWQEGPVNLRVGIEGWENQNIYKTEAIAIASPKNLELKENNKLRLIGEMYHNNESPNLFESKLFFDKSDIAYFDLDNKGDIHPIFHRMSLLSEGTTPPELIYNQQAKLLEKVTGMKLVKEWDEKTQIRLNAWEELDLNQKKALVSGETEGYNRTLMGIGFFSPYNLMSSLVTEEGKLPLNGEEANVILNEMGLPAMKFDELLADPKLLETVLNAKIRKGIELTKELTNNDNIRIRMVAAYMATGDVNNWNSDEYQMFTAKVLSSYKSGDTSAIVPLLKEFNMNGSTFKVDYSINESYIHPEGSVYNEEPANNFEGILEQLSKLDAEGIPPQFIDVAPIETGAVSGLLQRMLSKNPTRVVNEKYNSYIKFKQNLEDKRNIFQQLEGKGNINAGIFYNSLRRVLGDEKYNAINAEAGELFSRGRFVTKDKALIHVLVQQPEFANLDIADKYLKSLNMKLTVDPKRYDVGGDLVGNISKDDLIGIRGFPNAYDRTQGRVFIRKDAYNDWYRFFQDANANGHKFGINDGYRTNKEQEKLLKKKIRKGEEKDVKEPGKSNHNAGVSLDLDWATEADYQWLLDNYKNYNLCPHTGTPSLDMDSGNKAGEIEAWHWSWDPTGSCNLER